MSILSKIQKPRENQQKNQAFLAQPVTYWTLEQFVENRCPDATTADEIINSFKEDDEIVQIVVMGNPKEGSKRPFLMKGKELVDYFPVQDRNQLIRRIVEQEGFADSQMIRILPAEQWDEQVVAEQVVEVLEKKK